MAFTYTLKYSIKYKAMTSRFSQDMVRKKKPVISSYSVFYPVL